MNISELFIRRPVATLLFTICLVFIGIAGWRGLPVASLPNVDYPTITVRATLPGASPETMAASVAAPLEREFSLISGLDSITSASGQGSTRITLQFKLGHDLNAAALDVQQAINATSRQLPQEMTAPPSFRKVNAADAPVILLNLYSDTLPLSTLDDYAQTILLPRIARISGVADVSVYGSQKFAVRITVEPELLAARGMTILDVQSAIQNANSNSPLGVLSGPKQQITLQSNEQLQNAAEFEDLILAWQNGAPIRLSDIGYAKDSVENNKTASWFNGTRGITIAVERQPDANTVEVVDAVRAALPIIQDALPPAVQIGIQNDRSQSIRAAIADVQFTFALTVALVVLVIWMFLRRMSATIIPTIAMPVSLIATLGGMSAMGFSLDNISLLGLTLAVGLVVDDAIVMLENIQRHVDQGMSAFDAALKGSKEIGFTIISITVSLVAVFIPILLMEGVVGKLFYEFAVVVTMAIGLSAVVSLTLTPVMCARWLKPHGQVQEGRIGQALENAFNRVLGGYERSLDWALGHRRFMLSVMVGTLALTGLLFAIVPKGFFPTEDTGQLIVISEAAQDISYEAMVAQQQQVAKIVMENPYVASATYAVGISMVGSANNSGRVFVTLKDDRPKLDEVIASLRAPLSKLPGIQAFVTPTQTLNLGARSSKSEFQYTLEGINQAELYAFSEKLKAQMTADSSHFLDVATDLQISSPQAMVEIDREKAAALGVRVEDVRSTLYSAYGTREISTIYTPTNDYAVIIEMNPAHQADTDALSKLRVRSESGQLVPIDAIAMISRTVGPLLVNHQSQLTSVTLSFNLPKGVSLGEATTRVKQIEAEMGVPAGINGVFSGTAKVFQETLANQGWLIAAAIFVIYVVLGMLYESLIHPVTILSGLPSAAVGALATLLLFNQQFTVIALIGVLLLIGIVKKNAIMMIDFALDAQRHQNMPPHQAIRQACLLRFRPIMMTTMAALMGTLPIAVGHGAAAELRQPLGLAVVGGLLVSQLLTLYITPVLYLWFEEWAQRVKARQQVEA